MKSVVAVVLALAAGAGATVIDNGQFGSNIGQVGGLTGSDAYAQSFTATADTHLVKFGMWLQTVVLDPPTVRIDLWADDGAGNPDPNNILVQGAPIKQTVNDLARFDTDADIMLTPGQTYHVVINGFIDQLTPGDYNSTWDGGTDTVPGGTGQFTNTLGSLWFDLGGDFGVYVQTEGTCYPDCDKSGSLDLFDFLCFTNDFNLNGEYSNCDGNGTHDLFDFLCYVNAFNAGCPG